MKNKREKNNKPFQKMMRKDPKETLNTDFSSFEITDEWIDGYRKFLEGNGNCPDD